MYGGKVYVMRVKPNMNKNWEADDLVYGVGYEGTSGLTFNKFKEISEKNNSKWFVTKKANTKDDSACSWDKIIACMRNHPPFGTIQKLSLTNYAMTWLEIANLAYMEDIFTDEEGLAVVNELNRTAPNQSIDTTGKVSGPYQNITAMADKAKKAAEELVMNMDKVDTSKMSQGALFLTGQFRPQVLVETTELSDKSKDDLIDIIVKYKEVIVAADKKLCDYEAYMTAKNVVIDGHVKTINDLKLQLDAAKNVTVGFMAAADKANLEKKRLSDSLAAEVVTGLKPFIANQLKSIESSLSPVKGMLEPLEKVTKKVELVDENVVKLASDFSKSAAKTAAINDTNHESTIEYIGEVKAALAGVGIGAGATTLDIPATLLAMKQNMGLETQGTHVMKHLGNCTYELAVGYPNILTCTQDCGSVLHMQGTESSIGTAPQVTTPSVPSGGQLTPQNTPVVPYPPPTLPYSYPPPQSQQTNSYNTQPKYETGNRKERGEEKAKKRGYYNNNGGRGGGYKFQRFTEIPPAQDGQAGQSPQGQQHQHQQQQLQQQQHQQKYQQNQQYHNQYGGYGSQTGYPNMNSGQPLNMAPAQEQARPK